MRITRFIKIVINNYIYVKIQAMKNVQIYQHLHALIIKNKRKFRLELAKNCKRAQYFQINSRSPHKISASVSSK